MSQFGRVLHCKGWLEDDDPVVLEVKDFLRLWAHDKFNVESEVFIVRHWIVQDDKRIPREWVADDDGKEKITAVGIKCETKEK